MLGHHLKQHGNAYPFVSRTNQQSLMNVGLESTQRDKGDKHYTLWTGSIFDSIC